MSKDRERGTMLRTLNEEALAEKALAHMRVIAPEVEWVEATPLMGWAGKDTDDGLFVICTEGVGYKVGPGEPLTVGIDVKWRNKSGEVQGSMGGGYEVYLHEYEVKQLMDVDAGEDIDLADLVREFGDRLESNFWLWHRRLSA